MQTLQTVQFSWQETWNYSNNGLNIAVMHRDPNPLLVFENGTLTIQPRKNLKFYFGQFLVNSLEIVIF